MKIRDSQLNTLAAATMDRARRERLFDLRLRGFEVSEDSAGGAVVVRDAAGCSARVESRGLSCRVVSPEGRVTETEQYAGGRIRKIVDPSGHEVRFERDSSGFLKSIDRGPGGGTYGFELSQDWKPLRIDYPDGTTTRAEYSPTGQPIRIVNRDGTEICYEYGADGQLTALLDPQGRRTQLSAQGPGVSRAIEYPNGDRHLYVDDVAARLLRLDINGETHAQYQSDASGDSVETKYSDGTVEQFVFSKGRIVEAKNKYSAVKFEYDDAGRLTSEDTDGRVVKYLRNEVGALIGIVTPQGDTLSYARDRDQRLTGITDWSGDSYQITLPPSGPPSEIRYPNHLTAAMVTNATGLPATWSLRRTDASRELVDTASWEHDACDRLVAESRDGRRREFLYSKASRLVEVRSSDRNFDELFKLDSSGNRVDAGGKACTYDSMNRLLRQGSREFEYDGQGNQISDRDDQQFSSYSYNGRGQLIGVRKGGLTIEYEYDPLGRRIGKRVGGVTTRFQWAGTQLLSESTDDGNKVVRRDYVFCPEFLTPLAFREGPSVYNIHCGRLQEPLCVTDSNGQVVWKADYLSFGRAIASVEKIRQPLRLPGQYCDDETGLYYAVARYYDPSVGRFLSMDTRRVPGTSLNYYTYCDGDPVNRVDPTGEISLTLGTVLIAVGIGIVVGAAIGAGVELYKQRNQEHTDWGQVGTAAIIGGCLGGIGGAVGVVAEAATLGVLGVLGAGAAAGGLGAGVEYCVQAAGEGEWNWSEFGTAVAVGAGIGAITAGIGGIIAARAARRAARAAAEAAREAEERALREAAEAAREAEQRAAREAAQAAREAEERAAREAAAQRNLPQKARDATEWVDNNGGSANAPPRPGYTGGRTFQNDGRGGGALLPQADANGTPITYREWDVNPRTPGVNRGAERVVTGSDGNSYYTNDHYQTFTRIK
jgi:RHS repeat-associated protein